MHTPFSIRQLFFQHGYGTASLSWDDLSLRRLEEVCTSYRFFVLAFLLLFWLLDVRSVLLILEASSLFL